MTPWTVAQQTALSMGFSRKEYWNGLPFPPPGDLPDPGIEPTSPALQVDSFTTEPPGKPFYPVAAAAAKSLQSCRLLATPWTAAYQAPPSMGFSRQECWSGVPSPSPRDTKRTANSSFLFLARLSQVTYHVITELPALMFMRVFYQNML